VFKGGPRGTFEAGQPAALDTVRGQTGRIGQANAAIQGRGNSSGAKYQSFQIRTESLSIAQQNTLEQDLASAVGAKAFGAKNVSSSFGRQIANSALLAIFFSLL